MNAIITNTITDALLSLFVAYIAIASLVYRAQGDKRFTRTIVIFFATLFFLTALGSLVHYLTDRASEPTLKAIWLAISAGTVYLNYSLIYAIKVPEPIRMLVVFIALLFLYLFNFSLQFIYIALSFIFIYVLAFVYSRDLTRVGFLAVIISNILWIVVRKGINYELGYPLPLEYRYDNDIYHFLIILSVYIVYRSIKEGDWTYPKSESTL